MALKGDLANVNLADIFQTLAMNRQEGVLVITAESRVKKIYFKEGRIALLASRNKRGFRLGDRLISLGRLAPEDLNIALLKHEASNLPLGQVLVEMGRATQEDIEDALRFQAEEEIYDLFTWRDAHFEFVEGPPVLQPTDNTEIAKVFFDTSGVVMEAARRMDEWEVIRQEIPDLNYVYVCEQPPQEGEEEDIGWLAMKVLQLVNGRRSVYDLADETSYSIFDLAKILCGFLKEGRLRLAMLDELAHALEELTKEKEWHRALNIITQVIAQSADKLPYLKRAADLSHRTGRFEDASYYYVELAKHHESENDLVAAEKYLRRSVKLDLRNEDIHEHLLRVLAARGEWDQYVEHSLKSADLAAKAGAYDRAREILERSATERPEDVQVISQLANIYIKLNRKDEAIARLQAVLSHLHPKKDRKKIEFIGEKLLKLGHRDGKVVKLLQGAQESRRASTKRKLVVAASLVPVLAITSYLYKGYQLQRQANEILFEAQRAWEAGDLKKATIVLRRLSDHDPEGRYCLEGPALSRKVKEMLRQEEKAVQAARDKENQFLFQVAAQRVEKKEYSDAVRQYLKLGEKNKTGQWRRNVENRLDILKDVLIQELDRLRKGRTALSLSTAKLGGGTAVLDKYDDLLCTPIKEKVMELTLQMRSFEGPKELLTRVHELNEPSKQILAFFDEIYKERQMHEEVIRKQELYNYVNGEFVAARKALAGGDLGLAKRHLSNIVNSSYNESFLAEIKLLLAEVDEIMDLVKKTKKSKDIERVRLLFERVRKILTKYPQLNSTMKLPLQIKTIPAGARIYKRGKLLGTADPSLNITYQRESNDVIEIRLDGFAPLRRSLKDNTDWLWEVTLVREVVRSWFLGGPSEASPRFDGRYVFVPCRDGALYVIDPRREAFVSKLKTPSIGGCPAPVAFEGNELYFPVQEGILHAYGRQDWQPRWTKDLGEPVYVTPTLTDDLVVIGTDGGVVKAFKRDNGEEIWTFQAADKIRAHPVAHGDRIYVASFDHHLYALDGDTGRIKWKFKAEEVLEAAPTIGPDGIIYLVDKWRYLYALDPSTGEAVWKAKVGGGTARPIAYNGDVFVATTDAGLKRLRASDGGEIRTYKAAGSITAAPVIEDDRIYLTAKDGHLWVFDLASGKALWKFETGAPILTTPVIVGKYVLVVSTDRRAYMFLK